MNKLRFCSNLFSKLWQYFIPTHIPTHIHTQLDIVVLVKSSCSSGLKLFLWLDIFHRKRCYQSNMFSCVTIMYENGISKNLDNAKIDNHCNDLIRLFSICLGILLLITDWFNSFEEFNHYKFKYKYSRCCCCYRWYLMCLLFVTEFHYVPIKKTFFSSKSAPVTL